MSFFSFLKRYNNIGVGTGDLGLKPFQTLPAGGSYMGNTGQRKWNIQRNLGPINSPGFMLLNGAVVPVSLIGNGIELAGQLGLSPLASDRK